MGHLLKLKYALWHLKVRILASSSVPFRLTRVQLKNLALIETNGLQCVELRHIFGLYSCLVSSFYLTITCILKLSILLFYFLLIGWLWYQQEPIRGLQTRVKKAVDWERARRRSFSTLNLKFFPLPIRTVWSWGEERVGVVDKDRPHRLPETGESHKICKCLILRRGESWSSEQR